MHEIQSDNRLTALASYVDRQSRPVTPSLLMDAERKLLIANYTAAGWQRTISPLKAVQWHRAIGSICAPECGPDEGDMRRS